MTVSTVDRSEQRLVLWLLALLTVVLVYATAAAFGATAKGILHWTGVVLLVAGISLAAKGISAIRREWTGRPGIRASVRQEHPRFGSDFWQGRTFLAGQETVARLLRFRRHGRDAAAGRPEAGPSASATGGDTGRGPAGGLRPETWGIVCLLAGTILTAFW